MWEYLVAKLSVLIVICLSTLLIVIYPMINKHSKGFAKISLIVGLLVLIILMYFLFGNSVIRDQILNYGFN